jgi:hypothetical protein
VASQDSRLTPLARNILSAAQLSRREVVYLLIYGSTKRNHEPRRDIDALLVSASSEPRYVTAPLHSSTLNLHIVTSSIIHNDLFRDAYGWIFLTKFLSPFRTEIGPAELPAQHRAFAYLRLLGQWLAEHDVTEMAGLADSFEKVVDVLSRWNPQFTAYTSDGRIVTSDYRNYVTHELPSRPEMRRLFHLAPDKFTVRKRSPLYHKADLRSVLAQYWCLYVTYKIAPSSYLSDEVTALLRKKGAI